MSTITKEQAKDLRNAFQCWQQDYGPVEDKEQYDMFGMAIVAMDALLTSLEAEPVYQVLVDGSWTDYDKQHLEELLEAKPSTLFRVAYPSPRIMNPVSVDADDNFYSWFGREWHEHYQHNQYTTAAKQMLGVMAESAWKAGRRAAMLQGSQPVSNRDELPENVSTVLAEAYQVVGVMAEALGIFDDAAVQKVMDNLSQQKLVHSDVLPFSLPTGNSPVTPDGLVGCGENCWSCGKYFTYEQHSECDGYCPHCDSPVDLDDEEDEQSKAVPAKPTEDMISNAWRESLGKCDHETIRRMYVAMLAAAPKQEVK
ncbi:TPA: hypothetical protein ACKFCW_001996 [Citrobacter farmeri]